MINKISGSNTVGWTQELPNILGPIMWKKSHLTFKRIIRTIYKAQMKKKMHILEVYFISLQPRQI